MGLDGRKEEWIADIEVHSLGLQRGGRLVEKNHGSDGEDDRLLNHAHLSLENDLPEAVDHGQLERRRVLFELQLREVALEGHNGGIFVKQWCHLSCISIEHASHEASLELVL